MSLASSNKLSAEVVNRFLYYLMNPEESGVQDPQNPHYRDAICDTIITDISSDAKFAECLRDCGDMFNRSYVDSIITSNRRTVPYTADDIEYANNSGISVINLNVSPDFNIHCCHNDPPSAEGFRIIS